MSQNILTQNLNNLKQANLDQYQLTSINKISPRYYDLQLNVLNTNQKGNLSTKQSPRDLNDNNTINNDNVIHSANLKTEESKDQPYNNNAKTQKMYFSSQQKPYLQSDTHSHRYNNLVQDFYTPNSYNNRKQLQNNNNINVQNQAYQKRNLSQQQSQSNNSSVRSHLNNKNSQNNGYMVNNQQQLLNQQLLSSFGLDDKQYISNNNNYIQNQKNVVKSGSEKSFLQGNLGDSRSYINAMRALQSKVCQQQNEICLKQEEAQNLSRELQEVTGSLIGREGVDKQKLREEIQKLSQQCQQLYDEFQKNQQILNLKEKMIQDLQNQLQKVKNEKQQIEVSIDQSQKEAELQIGELRGQGEEKDQIIEDLYTQNQEHGEKIEEITQQFQEKQEEYEKEIQELKSTNLSKDEQIFSQKEEIQKIQGKNRKLENLLDENTRIIEEFQEKNHFLEQSQEEMRQNLEHEKLEIQEKMIENQKEHDKKYQQLQDKLNVQKKQDKKQSKEHKGLQESHSKLQQQYEQLIQELKSNSFMLSNFKSYQDKTFQTLPGFTTTTQERSQPNSVKSSQGPKKFFQDQDFLESSIKHTQNNNNNNNNQEFVSPYMKYPNDLLISDQKSKNVNFCDNIQDFNSSNNNNHEGNTININYISGNGGVNGQNGYISKSIFEMEQDIARQNMQYQEMLAKAKCEDDVVQRSQLRRNLIELGEKIKGNGQILLSLKKKEYNQQLQQGFQGQQQQQQQNQSQQQNLIRKSYQSNQSGSRYMGQ